MATVVKEIGMETSRWKHNTNANSVSVSNNLNVNKRETLQREYNNDKNISSIFDRFELGKNLRLFEYPIIKEIGRVETSRRLQRCLK